MELALQRTDGDSLVARVGGETKPCELSYRRQSTARCTERAPERVGVSGPNSATVRAMNSDRSHSRTTGP